MNGETPVSDPYADLRQRLGLPGTQPGQPAPPGPAGYSLPVVAPGKLYAGPTIKGVPTLDPGEYRNQFVSLPDGAVFQSDGKRWTFRPLHSVGPAREKWMREQATTEPTSPRAPSAVSGDPYADLRKRLGLPVQAPTQMPPAPARPGFDPLHAAAQGVETAQRFAANLPGIRQLGDIGRGVGQAFIGAPVLDPMTHIPTGRTYGEVLSETGQAVAENPAARWVEARLGNAPGVKQVGDWMRTHPQQANDVITLVNGGLNIAQLIPIVGYGAAGVRAGVTAIARGLTKDAAIQAARNTAAAGAGEAGRELAEDAVRQAAAATAGVAAGQEVQSGMRSAAEGTARAAMTRAAQPPLTVELPLSAQTRALLSGEAGGVNLQPLLQHLDRQHQVSTFAGDVGDQLYQIARQADASAVDVRNLVRTLGPQTTPKDWEVVYHALERPGSVTLSPEQQALHRAMAAIRDETEKVKLGLPKPIRPITGVGYVRRMPLGVGSVADRLQTGAFEGRPGLLRKTTSAFRHRTYVSLTDEAGNSRIASLVGDRLVTPDGTFLGTLGRVKSYEDLLGKDLVPAERALAGLDQQARVFTGWAERSPARVNAVADALAQRLRTVTDTLGNEITTLSPRLARDLQNERQRIAQLVDAFRDARAIGGMAAVKKLQSIQERMAAVRREIEGIKAGYDPASLEDRVFIARDGKRYRLGAPSTQEIEAQTGQQYYKNALVSALIDHNETMQIARASAFLEHLKTDESFLKVAAPQEQAWLHPTWVKTEVPQFMGWVMEPRAAAAFNAAMPATRDAHDIIKALRWISQASVSTGFINPLIHTPNVGTNWAIDRGVFRWINPASYVRLVKSGVKAWNAAAHINDDYLDVMRAGGAVMQENGAAAKVRDAILDMARRELQQNPQIVDGLAAHLGRTAHDIAHSPWWLSHRITWLSNDLAYMQRVFERELEGMPRQEAIRQTDRFIPNYRLPGTILGSQDLSRVFRDRGAVIFAPYHYSVLKSWGQMAKGLLGRVPLSERLEAADKLAMAGILLFVVAPAMDHVFQEITGNPRARARRPGLLAPVYDALRVSEGTLAPDYAIESVVSPSPLVGSALDVAERRAEWTSPVQSLPEKGGALLKIAAEGLAPLSIRSMIQSGTSLPQTLLAPVVTLPKFTPNESAVRTYLAQDRIHRQGAVDRLVEDGKRDQALRAAHGMNERLRALVTKALRDEGESESTISDLADQFVRKYGVKLLTESGQERKTERRATPFSVAEQIQRPTRGPRTYEREIP